MKIVKSIFSVFIYNVLLFASTPIEYSINFDSGYDSNVMRFSNEEFSNASIDRQLMGGVSTFDSFIYRLGIKGKKSIWNKGGKNIFLGGSYFWSNYNNNIHKKYWSGGFDLTFKWGAYNHLKYVLRNLDSYYLRHYINRDISISDMMPCFFSDRNQKIILTKRINRSHWFSAGFGYLQRYYDRPFTEFDLDIYYFHFRINKKIKKSLNISFQIEPFQAKDFFNENKHLPSNFDRSYESLEWYMPVSIKLNNLIVDKIGVSLKKESRYYEAEDPDDPLHTGRGHVDSKFDFWIKKRLFESVSVTFSTRYRTRETQSAFDWVKELKSFEQIQFWFNIDWDLVYDRY
ncbi:MAG: hypothetical protein CMG60_09035 [Candidatus Marinimicrobia bacterium]|nr:hypothetical protein [Candidatus Neomarinimicrobiota bacterium]